MSIGGQTGEQTCRDCGGALTDGGASGVCLRCALGSALDTAANEQTVRVDPATSGKETAVTPTTLTRFGDYELLEEIARGGMGVVYKARQISLDRLVAVKMILFGPLASAEQIRRFRTEASAAGCLQHPNIAAVHEVGLHGNQHYLVMDYVDGPTLGRLVGERPLPARDAARYVKVIAEAVHFAHERGILHRDLKPSNVLVDSEDRPRVVDFGLAKRFNEDSSLTLSGHVLGSPSYMPPEQAGAGRLKVGRYSDVYSLGAILYFLITARAPFQAETVAETLAMVVNREPLSPRLLNPAVPRDLETICLKCLEKEPAKRYASAQALAEELDRFYRHEPIQARPISGPERAWRWCRRKPALASLFVLVNVVGALGIAGILWQWRRAENNAASEALLRQEAQHRQSEAEAQRARADAEATRATESQQRSRRLLYVSDMNLAQEALRLSNLGKARHLLDRHRPQAGEEDLRGWEWRYLWQLTHGSAFFTLTNEPAPGFSLSFSTDGTRLAVGWFDGRTELWDVQKRHLVRILTDTSFRHQGRVAFSPVGNVLAATSQPRTVTLYDLDSKQESSLWRAPEEGPGIVRDLSFSADGSKAVIVAGSPSNLSGPPKVLVDDVVWIVNVSSGKVENQFPAGYNATFHFGTARLAPDNKRLYFGFGDSLNYHYRIKCLDLATGQEVWQTDALRDYGLTALAVSPNGQVIATASGFEDPTIRIWDCASGRMLLRLDGHLAWISHLEFSADGTTLISSATDQTVRLWDTRTWTQSKILRGHSDEVFSAAIAKSGQLIASTSKDGRLVLWNNDSSSGSDGYTRFAENLKITEPVPLGGSSLLLLHQDGAAEGWDLEKNCRHSLGALDCCTNVLGFFGTNSLCRWDGQRILVCDLNGGQLVQRGAVSVRSKMRPVGTAYYPPRQLVAWLETPDSTAVSIASPGSSRPPLALKADVSGLLPFRFSSDGKYLVAMARKLETVQSWDSLRAWNIESGQTVVAVDGIINDATFAAGDRVLVVSTTQGVESKVWFWDLAQPDRPPRVAGGFGFVLSLAATADGALVGASTTRGLVQLFHPLKGELIESIQAHLNAVFGVAFSPDGRRLLSASGGREAVKLWDVQTHQELLTLSGTGSALMNARWSPDGNLIIAGPPWQVWRAPSWEEIAAAEGVRPSSGAATSDNSAGPSSH